MFKDIFATHVDHLSRRLPTALHILSVYTFAHKPKVGNLSNGVDGISYADHAILMNDAKCPALLTKHPLFRVSISRRTCH